jgi:hypothetical protein
MAARRLTLIDLVSAYPALSALSSYLSTLDLFSLGLTSKAYYDCILASRTIFLKLSSQCICDGHGLRDRAACEGLYAFGRWRYTWGTGRKIHQDEEIEVRLFNRRCDASDTLPCCKCGINVCEECRFYPRVPPLRGYPVRRPHLTSTWELQNIMCLCDECDNKTEEEVRGKFLSELCDCDVFTRWICGKCRAEEQTWEMDYFKKHTEIVGVVEDSVTKMMGDHQDTRQVSTERVICLVSTCSRCVVLVLLQCSRPARYYTEMHLV